MTTIDRLALSIPFFLIGMTVLGKESKSVLPDRIEVVGIELIKVNPGNFTMGVKNLHPAIEPYDGPRRVEITQPFTLRSTRPHRRPGISGWTRTRAASRTTKGQSNK